MSAAAACAVASCDRASSARSYCQAHYKRMLRNGTTGADTPIRPKGMRGGGCITGDGYRVHTVGGVRVYEHRAVMEQVLGRPLLSTEHVHHVNGQRADNRPENLELWTTYQPAGQRVADLIAFVATHYADEILATIKENRA